MAAIVASFLLASAVNAKVLPREAEAPTVSRVSQSILPISTDEPDISTVTDVLPSTFTDLPKVTSADLGSRLSSVSADFSGTIFVGIPSQADFTTTTVSACTQADGEFIDSLVVVGVPTGTFSPGLTRTIVVPPQADPTTVTYYDYPPSNETEVIIIEPLPGNCGPLITPTGVSPGETASPTDTSTLPSNTAAACPTKGCSGAILRAAETVINAINEVTQLSMNLQKAAKQIGARPFPRADADADAAADADATPDETSAALFPSSPITDVALGLTRITTTVQLALPSFITFPPFPPSCSADTIVLAWLEFVRVHQELLAILIGRSGLLETGPLERRAAEGFVGRPVAVALRGIEGVVDSLAVGVVGLVPGRSECSKAKSGELRERIRKAEGSYGG